MATTAGERKGARLIRSFGQLGRGDVAFAAGKGADRVHDAAERRVLLEAAGTSSGGAR